MRVGRVHSSDHFGSYDIYPNSYSCNPCSFYPCPGGLINPSYNSPSDYPEAYKAGWEPARRER